MWRWAAGVLMTGSLACASAAYANDVRVTLPAGAAADAPIEGRLILVVSPNPEGEPRAQVDLEAPLRSPYQTVRKLTGRLPPNGSRVWAG